MKTPSYIPSTARLTIASLSNLKGVLPLRRVSLPSLIPDTPVAAFSSSARATFKTTRKTAFLLFSVAVLLAGGSAAVHGQSALDGFDPGANGTVYPLAVQADGKILVGGYFTTLGGGGTGTTTRNYIGRLNPDGTLDTSFNPGADNAVRALAVQPDGKILVGGSFTMLGGGGTGTTARYGIGRLNPDGSLDTSFNPGATGAVLALAVQPDGKILVGGNFSTLGGGGTGTNTRHNIGRLNSDGSLDTSFNPGAAYFVIALALQGDGKILVGGAFTTLGGGGTGTTTRNHIGRINVDGTLDASFNPGANDTIGSLAVQADGKILVGGTFSTLGGGGTGTTPRNKIGRLNPDGTLDTSFNPGANNSVITLAVQADGKILAGGLFTTLGGGGTGTTMRNYIGRLHPNGSLDTSFNPGANNWVRGTLAVQADGKILVGGDFSGLGGGTGITTRNRIGRLHPNPSLDANLNPGANGTVIALAMQADGKILVGGGFTTLGGGGTGTTTRNRIGRLIADGSLDPSFNPGANSGVYALAVQVDGKILVGGDFTALGGGTGTITRNYIGRLNPDGSLDTSFNPGANGAILALAVQADGKILVGGDFTTLGGGGTGTTTRNRIGRLNPNGSLDTSFNPGANNAVATLAVQADAKILVGGDFTTLGGGTGTTTRNHIGRLNPDGTVDTSFNPGANTVVYALAVQADGTILVGGLFTGLGGGTGTTTRNRIGRLKPGGLLDSFNPGANSYIQTLAVQADGKILVGGGFTMLGGGTGTTTRNYIGRLNPDGSLDTSFNPGANATVGALAVQADGKILVGGTFSTLGGGGTGITTRNRIGRLTNTDAAFQELTADTNGTTILWNRSGASPEIDRVNFELSTDAINYSALPNPGRITGGWQLTKNLPIHQNIFIRARGFYSTGWFNGSGSIVETVRNAFISPPPTPTEIVSQKTHGANSFGVNLPLTGSPGIECRTGGAAGNHQVQVTFAVPVTFTFAGVTSGMGSVTNAIGNGTAAVTVNLTGVANAQRITVTLFGVNDGTDTGNLAIPMGVLLGDVTGGTLVNASDVSQTKSKSGQVVGLSNFRADVTVNNSINASDVALVKSKSGTGLP